MNIISDNGLLCSNDEDKIVDNNVAPDFDMLYPDYFCPRIDGDVLAYRFEAVLHLTRPLGD